MNGGALHCFFCGGSNCKYEKYEVWKDSPHTHIGIEGLFSNWITDDILATARPSSKVISEYKIIEQFKRFGGEIQLNKIQQKYTWNHKSSTSRRTRTLR